MKDTTPRNCAWCGGLILHQSPNGRRRDYCRQSCRQRAYEARRTAELIAQAVAAATESSRELSPVEAAAYPPLPPRRPQPVEDRPEGPLRLF